jgi:hypothetical protein
MQSEFAIGRDRIYPHVKQSADGFAQMSDSDVGANSDIASVQLKRAGGRAAGGDSQPDLPPNAVALDSQNWFLPIMER